MRVASSIKPAAGPLPPHRHVVVVGVLSQAAVVEGPGQVVHGILEKEEESGVRVYGVWRMVDNMWSTAYF